jgi:hypothetical protein
MAWRLSDPHQRALFGESGMALSHCQLSRASIKTRLPGFFNGIPSIPAVAFRRISSKSSPGGNLDAKAQRRKEHQEDRMNLELMNSGTRFCITGHDFRFFLSS